jgi:hypothetical protein
VNSGIHHLHQAKIGNKGIAAFIKKDVARFDVAVKNTNRVGGIQRPSYLAHRWPQQELPQAVIVQFLA